jgi:hypothetical protein
MAAYTGHTDETEILGERLVAEKNKDEVRRKWREYYAKNKEAILAKQRRLYAENTRKGKTRSGKRRPLTPAGREASRKACRRYAEKNRGRLLAYWAQWRADNQERYERNNLNWRERAARREASVLNLELMTITPSSLADVAARLDGR